MDRRTQISDKQAELEHQCFNLFPERWGSLYREQLLPSSGIANAPGDVGTAFDGAVEKPVTSIDDLNAWYEGRESTRRMSGAETIPFENDLGSWIEGNGGFEV